MKNIKINTPFKSFLYGLSVTGFITMGFIFSWVIAFFLYSYGKDTPENKEKKRGLLNMTYQKWIYIYGNITGIVLILAFIVSLFQLIMWEIILIDFIIAWSIPIIIFVIAYERGIKFRKV